ncbi:MAG: nucleotidyltransferase [bacterium]
MMDKFIVKIADILKKTRIPYMIIGGQAVLLYGEPRLTKDIDITLGIGIDELDKIIDIMKKIGLKALCENVKSFVKETYVLPTQNVKNSIRVDFIFSYTVYERQAIKRVNKIKINTGFVNFASIEDLIIHKIFAGRKRDIEDVKTIILKNPKIDKKYIKYWLKKFGKNFPASFDKLVIIK